MKKFFIYNNQKNLFLKRFLLMVIIFSIVKTPVNILYIRDILNTNISIFYRIHSVVAIVSHTLIEISLIFVGILFVYKLFKKLPPLSVFVCVFTLDVLISVVDVIILSIYGFHINSYIISEILQPNFFSASGISIFSFIAYVSFLVLFGLLFYLTLVRILKRVNKPFVLAEKKIWKRIAIFVLLVLIIEKVFLSINLIYSPAYTSQLKRNIPVFYLSYIVRIHEILTEKLKLDIKDEKESYDFLLDSTLDSIYPIDKNVILKHKYNVLLLILESTRSDYFNSENFPNTMKLVEEKGFSFTKNYSASNSTHMGVFGIIYSLNPHYSEEVKTKRKKSFPFEVFKKNNYNTLFYVSGDSSWHHMDYFLKQNFDTNKDYASFSSSGCERDSRMVEDLLSEISSVKNNFLYGLFFDSMHYPYTFPKEFQHNKPFLEKPLSTKDYLFLEKLQPELINSYKNSLLYADSLINKIINKLVSTGKDKNTIVIITSDHGEEFGDQGNYFHASSLNNFQTKVPLAIIVPDKFKNLQKPDVVTSNMDIFPTLFDLMEADYSDNFQGKSVFRRTTSSFVSVAYQDRRRPKKFAVIGNNAKCIINTESSKVVESVLDIADDSEIGNFSSRNHVNFLFDELFQFKAKARQVSKNIE